MLLQELMALSEAKKLDPTLTAVFIELDTSYRRWDDGDDKFRERNYRTDTCVVHCESAEEAAALITLMKAEAKDREFPANLASSIIMELADDQLESPEYETMKTKLKATLVNTSHQADHVFRTVKEFKHLAELE